MLFVDFDFQAVVEGEPHTVDTVPVEVGEQDVQLVTIDDDHAGHRVEFEVEPSPDQLADCRRPSGVVV
ncbi:hypothetical protein CF165_08840 [Amycolatopsis vastitatis]|uniref:Uncharacterized protein n=1 Tax=Amycolatopsis vastitatis TaxID=1905142 RepID=A0A229TEC2_9PSEU|nr:hypothetical protein CF165_08840 [Amycolatopsis vastitatis]